MPRNHELLPMSLVTFSRSANEEIFLLYSKGFEDGPGIQRDGQGSPWMIDADTQTRKITDPHEQRKGTWLINPDAREFVQKSIPEWENFVTVQRNKKLMEPDDAEHRLKYYETLVKSVGNLSDYNSIFESTYPNYRIIGMQGCGNLTMNEWYVAYLNSKFTENKPIFISLPEDRKNRVPPRQYTCLIKYKDGRIRVERLLFNFLKKQINLYQNRKDITEDIEFAVYGTQVLGKGELVDFGDIVEQIADVRHLFKLPNLNPSDETDTVPNHRPRRFFGRQQYDDVWFGEAELLKNLALRRAALTEPALFNRQFENMGADAEHVQEMFGKQGYREDKVPLRTLRYSDGNWRFRQESDELVEVRLLRNVYAYSLLGVDESGENIFAMAVGGLAGRRGQTLEAAVQNIRSYGATNAILVDQGDDVFQYASSDKGVYEARVKPIRAQLRAVFMFGAPKKS